MATDVETSDYNSFSTGRAKGLFRGSSESISKSVRIVVSACLMGQKVRYDGRHTLNTLIRDVLGKYVELIPICPEVEIGLGIPREPMYLKSHAEGLRLVRVNTKKDLTHCFTKWCERKLKELKTQEIWGGIFKTKSPSCAVSNATVVTEKKSTRKGAGLFIRAFSDAFPYSPIEDEVRICYPERLESFFQRMFVFKRWRDLIHPCFSLNELKNFHIRHQLIIMSYSPRGANYLKNLLNQCDVSDPKDLALHYGQFLVRAMNERPTVRKHAMVLSSIFKNLKKYLSTEELQIYLSMLDSFRKRLVPLVVPLSLLRFYLVKYRQLRCEHDFYVNIPDLILRICYSL